MEFNGAFQVKAISGEQRLDSRQGKRVDLVIPEFKVKPQVIKNKVLTQQKKAVSINVKTDSVKRTSQLQMGSSGTIYDANDDTQSRNEDSYYPSDSFRPSEYSINAYQKLMCSYSGLGASNIQSAPNYISTAFKFNSQIQLSTYKKVINTLFERYLVLRTEFYVNPKIIDADVQARITSLPILETINLNQVDGVTFQERLQVVAETWILDRTALDVAFKILVVEHTGDVRCPSAVIAIASKALLDTSSLLHIMNEAQVIYGQIADMNDIQSTEYLQNYDADEDEDAFINLSTHDQFNVTNEASVKFWRSQYVEYTHNFVDESSRQKLERKEREGEYRHDRIKTDLYKLVEKKEYLVTELAKQKEIRKEYERISYGKSSSFYDFTSGIVMPITPEALYVFKKTFLKIDIETIQVTDLLEKYQLAPDILDAILGSYPTFEKFLEITEEAAQILSKSPVDSRKIIIASETCRNFILEAHHQHCKTKYTIERLIAKLSRDLVSCASTLKQRQRDLIKAGEENMAIRSTLNPPVDEFKISPLTLDFNIKQKVVDSDTLHDSIVFKIPEDSYLRMKEFHSSSFMQSSSTKKETLELSEIPLEIYESLGMAALCLASVGILLRHVTGESKFIIGFAMKLAYCRMRVGPLSPIVPIKVDLSDGNQTMFAFVKKIHEALCQGYHHTITFPYRRYDDDLCPEQMNVVFEYCGDIEGYLYDSDAIVFVNDNSEVYDLKVSARQSTQGMKFAMRYRNDRIKESQVERWADRILSTLESIDFVQRHMSIASFVTRFYNEIWMSKSSISLEKISKRTSSQSLTNLFQE